MATDQRHKWVFSKVAECLNLEAHIIQDAVQRTNKINILSEFFKDTGPSKLLFYYQLPQKVNEYGDVISIEGKHKIVVTDGSEDGLRGKCVYFLRITNKSVTPNKIEDEVVYGNLDNSLLEELQETLDEVMVPALYEQEAWGELGREKAQGEFLDQVKRFTSTLLDALLSLKDSVRLERPEQKWQIESTQAAISRAASNPDLVENYENTVQGWCHHLEQVLAESELIRKENDDVGPNTELEYWKARMAKFNSITDQLRSKEFTAVISVLKLSKSKILKKWKELDARITDAANEAKDNVKYLYTLEKNCETLYKGDPTTILEGLPALLNAIKMMHSIARYYNTSERMTTLFVKITNQMIINCRAYLLQGGTLWEQDGPAVIAKLKACLHLRDVYKEQYQIVKNQPHGKPFNFSEVTIFGKFDMFCKRLARLIELFETVEMFQPLTEATMEGLEAMVSRFEEIVQELRKKPYDLTDHRKPDFEVDYKIFVQSIYSLEETLIEFMNDSFAHATSTERNIVLLHQFSKIMLRERLQNSLEIKYTDVFNKYGVDLLDIMEHYESHKQSPPIPRNTPPVSGNISWARQLLRRIELPMNVFRAHNDLVKRKESRPVIRTHNKLLRTLIQFEVVWHEGWADAVNEAKSGLVATLLVRHPESREIYVNFDHDILRLMRETKSLQRMDLDVPQTALTVVLQEEKLKSYSDRLQHMLKRYYKLINSVPSSYHSLVVPQLEELERLIEPGLSTFTWTSLNIDSYINTVHTYMNRLEELVAKANDILQFRIHQNLKQIQRTPLVDLPASASLVTIEDFVEQQETFMSQQAPMIERKNQEVETAVNDLVALLTGYLDAEARQDVAAAVSEFVTHHSKALFDSLLQCAKNSLNILKKRFASHSFGMLYIENPVFRVDVELEIPNVVLRPSLDQIQTIVNYVGSQSLQSTKQVYLWGQDRSLPENELKSFFHDIASNREIVKAVLQLKGSFTGLRRSCDQFLESFHAFAYLWKGSKQEEFEKFDHNPSLDDYERELEKYDQAAKDIDKLDPYRIVGSLSLDTSSVRESLRKEANDWKQMYGSKLNSDTKKRMKELIDFIEDTKAQLERKTKDLDLDDVNNMMQVLERLRVMEAEIHMKLAPVEDTYSMLNKYNVHVRKEELEELEMMNYKWGKLQERANTTMDYLQSIAPPMREQLLKNIEVFLVDVKQFKKEYDERGPMSVPDNPRLASDRLKQFTDIFEDKERKWDMYTRGEELFGLEPTEYPELVQIQQEIGLLTKLYGLYNDVIETIAGYKDYAWANVDIQRMENELADFALRCRKMPKQLRDYEAYNDLKNTIDDFNNTLPLLVFLKHEAVVDRHWEQVSELCGVPLDYKSPEFTIRNLMEADILSIKDDIEEISSAAVKEADIKVKFEKIKDDWVDQKLVFATFKKRGDLTLKPADTADIMSGLEDAQMALGGLLGNRYNKPFREQIQKWLVMLTTCQERLELWLQVQALWIYLEAVFSGGDIAAQMPQEAKRFSNIDKQWERILISARDNPNVINFCYKEEILKNLLPSLQEQLDICQKSLAGYLEQKRGIFPRFFFVSDAQLLEILGQGSNPHTIQPHLTSCFSAFAHADFDKVQRNKILGMDSPQGEHVDFTAPVVAEGNIEDWLNKLKSEMIRTVKDICRNMTKEAISLLNTLDREQLELFLEKYPAQVSLLGVQLWWSFESEEALANARNDKTAMPTGRKKFEAILRHLIDITTMDLKKMERTRVETLITIHIHQVDIFNDLIKKRCKSKDDFEWLKQTRFYWKSDVDDAEVRITNCDLSYGYEYLGVAERLVITPLTDRIYISCAQAMAMFYGGAPAGPAGTGKTETTKDMGATCGRYFITINCSDQMDYRAMGKLYKGIAQAGLWCGFDEINRVDLAVLSVVAAQISCVFAALKAAKAEFVFTDGQMVKLELTAGCFITMNPGYAGRTELPENMKALFRTIAVVVPDRQIIMRVKLASAGFQEAVPLAKKFFVLYRLCEEQLSKQNHYDFGLRNILSVLRTCGANKRANPSQKEIMVLMRVVRDMNLSKLVDEDEPLFLSLIKDLFPGVQVDKETYPEIQQAITQFVEDSGLVDEKGWNTKIVQLYEQYRVRHGLCIMGPTGGGKTSCINSLAKAMTETGTKVKQHRMNPKAITATQMFGKLDIATNDWTDGIFSALWRTACRTKAPDMSWIELDGPVDAVWIENLNTVLDDTKTLTLANGDRILMPPTVKLVFEVGDLANASPATVSRLGIVFMGENALGWRPIIGAWAKTRAAAGEGQTVLTNCDKLLPDLFLWMLDNVDPKMSNTRANLVANLLTLMTGLLPTTEDPKAQIGENHIVKLIVFALIWSLGGTLESEDRMKFHAYLQKQKLPLPEVGAGESVYEYVVDDKGEWEHWKKRVPNYTYPGPPFSAVLVPTVDNIRTTFLIEVVAKQKVPVLLIGESGTAKTVTIQQYLQRQDPDQVKNKMVAFSSATTPGIFQRVIEASVEKRMGSTYGPVGGKQMIAFIDDINMPEINEWGDQITNEIVRQLIEQGGFYTLESKSPGLFLTITDMTYVAAMNQPGGGRNDIPSRLKRQFNIFNVTLPSTVSVEVIFGIIATGHFCAANGFSTQVQETAKKLPSLTRRLWEATKKKMLPTPAKFHYIFNLRDLSKIFQGLVYSESEVITGSDLLLRLWKHECDRVLPDKFTNEEDINWFHNTARDLLIEEFGVEVADPIIDSPSFFVDFLRDPEEPENPEEDEPEIPHVYEPIEDMESLRGRISLFMNQYNETLRGSKMELVLFEFALEHLMRISRIIRTPRGNALLVGVGGSGKQSLTRLASHVAGCKTFQITITRSYNVTNLIEDLRILYKLASSGKPVVFLFTDNEVKEEGFLEYVNMILTSGEIPGLFPKDELDQLLDELRSPAKKERSGFIDTPENLYNYMLDKVRDNLHVVLCFSPVGEKFRSRARKFPGLISGCTIDWFPPWPEQALYSTAKSFLNDFNIVCTNQIKESLVQHMCFVHSDVGATCQDYFNRYRRNVYVTPRSYLVFIDSFKTVYTSKVAATNQLADRVNTGLKKLLEAGEDVAKMKVQLIQKEKDLGVAQKKCSEFLVEITQQTAIAQKKKDEVQKVKDECLAVARSIERDKAEAEKDLEAAVPALQRAEAALNLIKPGDIATIKKLAKPPPLVKRIMDGVLILRGFPVEPFKIDPDFLPDRSLPIPSWSAATTMMSDLKFLQALQEFPKEAINDETCELLNPYLQMSDFNFESAKKASGNVAGLCTWIAAMEEFHFIYVEVEPKKARLREAESKLRVAEKELNAAQAELDAKQAELDAMQAKYDEAMRQKQELQDDAELTAKRLNAAESLISGLSGERERWTQQSKEFEEQIKQLVGDVALACAFLSYCGPFNSEFRTMLLSNHFVPDLRSKGIPFSKDFDLVKFLTTESKIDKWNLEGLPRDELSIQNGIIVTTSTRYPLLVDPQGQGKKWVKNRHEDMIATSLNNKFFRNHLEDSLQNGQVLLIEDVLEEIDPVLDPVLQKDYIRSGKNRLRLKIGDKEVDFEKTFMLYITTKLPNPHYSPETSAKCAIIDFTVTMKGLEDQLLVNIILQEKADLEQSRQELLKEIADCKSKAEECEEQLLYKLSSVQGNLLDDSSIIDVLSQTKAVSQEVKEKLLVAKDTEVSITNAREEFRPAAHRMAVMYFVITELNVVNHCYNTSLPQFLQLVDHSLHNAKADPIVAKRVVNIIEFATYHIYKYVQRGLYEDDKPMYQLLLTMKIDLYLGKIPQDEFQGLLRGGGALDINSLPAAPKWVPDPAWLNLNALIKFPLFSMMIDQMKNNQDAWKTWFDYEDPENHPMPDGYEERCNTFQKLLVVRSWREDRTMTCAKQYIISSIGQQFVEGIPMDFELMHEESTPQVPMIGLLSMGSDPSSTIEGLAKKMKLNLTAVSMGQGQEPRAREALKTAMTSGGWVLLQNCHLVIAWLEAELEDIITSIDLDTCDPTFRLWITAEPYTNFPVNLLQLSIKYTNEPPQGIKASLRRSYAWLSQDILEKVDNAQWPKLLYATCFLHSVLIERKRFGPIGWCIMYEFNQTDLAASVQFLENYMYNLDPKKPISWTTVRYMVCEVQYGGRITDDFDKRLLVTYGNSWLDNSLFATGFQFYDQYGMPEGKNINDYRGFVEQLPLVDTPQVQGLHPNAEITFSATFGNSVLSTITSVQPKESGGGGGETREDAVKKTAIDLEARLPPDYNMNKVKVQIDKQGGPKPLNVCLRQEVERMQICLSLMRFTLKNLQLAIAGTVIMSTDLQDALNALFDARVPPKWIKVSWPSPTLGYWFADLLVRCQQYTSWLNEGRPLVYWLTGFFNPQGFLTAMKQESTRLPAHQGWALDAVTLQTEVLKVKREDIKSPAPEGGVYLYGLYLEGAGWDVSHTRLVDPKPKELFTEMPVILVTGINTSQALDTSRFYVCPVYKLPRRTDLNYIFDVTLKTDEPPEKWVLRGVALLSSRV